MRPNFDKRLVNLSPEHSTPTSKRHKSLLVQRIGRPRKYDKSSVFNDVGNEDLLPKKEIHRSEKMAEKYVRRKIEDEISWRLEEGGDAVSVTKQVLAEVMALRKEEGQEPLPTPSTEMIFQKFAGGPEPGPVKGKSRGRRKRAPYWPSMAAHTIPIPKSLKKPGKGAQRPPQEADGILVSNVRKRRLPARLLESENEAGLSPLMKKRCRLIITDRVADIFCLPSVAAHSWPCIPPPSLKVRVSDGKEKRKPGRPRTPKDPATTLSEQEKATQPRFRYLPSIAAHSGVFLPLLLQPTKAPAKRKRAPKQPVERDAVPVALGSHSTDSQTPLPLQLRAVSEVGLAPVSSSLSHEGPYPGWIRFMSKYYDAELKSILRPHEGVFAGVTKPRRKRNCEPADFRPRNLKVIVFKCARLQQIEWFTTETECSKGVQSHVVARESPNRPFIQHILPSIPVQTPRTPIAEAPSQSQTPLNQSVKLPPFNPQPPLVELSHGIIGSVHPSMSPIAEGAMTDTIGSPRDFLPDEDRPPIMESLHPQVLQTTSSPIVQSSSASVGRVLPPFTEASDVATQESSCSVLDVAPHTTTLESGNNTSLTEGTPAPVKDKQILVLYPANESMENEPNTADDNEGNRDKQDDAQHPDASMIDVSVLAGQSQSSTTEKKSDRTLDLVGSSVSHESVSNQPSTFPGASAVQIVEDTNVGQQNPTLSDSSLLRSFLSLSREIEARKGDENLVQESRSSEHPPPESDRNSARGAFKRFTRNSGSVPLLRERVVMDIIRRCEGVFPGYKEMCRPFAAEWSKIGQEGTPEEKTIKNAIDALHGKRQLQKHIYVFDSKQGIRVKGTILTLPDVDVADPRVKDIRANIMAYYPRNYFPPALESLAESLNTNVGHSTFVGEKHPELSQMINLGKNKAAKATLAAMKAEEQRHLERDTGTGEQAEGEDTDSSLDMIHGPVMRVPIVQHRPPSHTKGKRLRGGRVERPAGSRNSSNAVADQESLPQPASHQLNRSTELTWLPKEYAFSEYNFEEERPTVLEPTVLLDTHRLHAPYGQRLRPPKPPRRKKIKSSTDLPSQVRSSPPYSSPYAAETSWDKTEPSVEDTQTTSSPSPKPPGADSQPTWPVTGPKTAVPSQTVEQTHGFQLRLKEAVVNFMDATHYFYQTTGTFSVGFSGLSPARPINKKVGTCWKPYSLGPRNIHLEFPAPRGPRKLLPKRPLGAEDTQFEKEVDASLEWELETAELQHIRFKVLTFVNYTFHHAHVTAAAVDAMMDSIKEIQMSSRKGRMYTRKIPQLNNARPKIGKSIFSVGAKNISHAAAEAFKRIDSRASLKRRRLTSLVENQGHDETTEVPLDENSRPSKLRRIRGPRGARLLGEEGESRLLTAVTLVRTLTGGLEKRIDWVLAAKAFGPDTSVMFIQGRWSYVLQKHKMMLPKMEDDFQELFVEAYQKGTIPAIDFDNLAEYDWKWLTEWTMKQLRTASKTQPDLPTDRAKFHDLYELKEAPDVDISDYYGINGSGTTIASRTSLISKKAYVHAAVKDQEGVPSQELEQFKAAKTWVRANVITPEDTYNPSLARDKLRILPTHTIDDALKQLLLDKVLTQENKGRLIPGRNYDISEQFISRLKKNILPEHFQRAVAYKLHIDQKFEAQEFVPYSPTADDGEMLAIINLLAHQRIKLVPVSIPTKKWGHLDGKYESRQMDKTRLNFQMELHPTPAYVLGNPLRPLPEPPSQHLEDLAAKIPLWYDIHDAFVPVVWEMALAAVMAILAVRPGVGAEEIAKAMRPAMEAWELEKVLEWMAEAKAATRVGSGYLLDEWWWLAFAGKEDKGKGKERAVD